MNYCTHVGKCLHQHVRVFNMYMCKHLVSITSSIYTRLPLCSRLPCVCVCVFVYLCACAVAAGRLKIVSPLRASLSLQHVGTMARCQDTSPSSVLTRRHEEQRLIIYKQTPVHHVWLGTSPALNVTIYEAIHFIAYSI